MNKEIKSISTSQLISQTKDLKKALENRQKDLIKTEKSNTKQLEKKVAKIQKEYGKYSNVSSNISTFQKFKNKLKNPLKKKSRKIFWSSKTSSFFRKIKKIEEKSRQLSPMRVIVLLSMLILTIQIIIPNNTYYIDNTNINYKMKQSEGMYSVILLTLTLWILIVLFYVYAMMFRVEPIGDFSGGEY